ncbi:DUF72 domain-containing protein [Trinickia caryophylli]|uniref:Uncharacterized conserved protein YecE, DUF72 family n=1 Tax=Trinickia caryophylli TaxID=28094 RepID=A0A1X7EAZ4_TRICW|nr:DUF72 domain-containing protein [Trinickia caryophylli]PMS12958.1 DUF72 domain-containing protein [Trinickia caryophylli]TRX14721.1 DUF72 domain-containing protein [Trinickia caryophylli]WQE14564.1 DUF72 domain-containing protein [Trinickia caryophylli]SMF30736.1 Uncharacterized conserved protein YecE, DUF72 family [Trinickia caryophylli]GLU32026.1 hypothetical protein Busp01_18680 [Trinickia caryophylli]
MTIRIGISGWRYAGWRGVFYPKELRQAQELAYASRAVDTIEINGSHYSLQTVGSYRAWHDATPAGFVFSVKGPRYLTHMLRFRDESARPAIANFFASGVLALAPKLGPFLWQFPPNFPFDADRLERFLALLPATTGDAAALAARHDTRVKQPWFEIDANAPLRHAVEIRHASFCTPEFVAILRRHGAALVVSDSVAGWPYAEDVTSDFVYMRLHGTETLYSGAYPDPALERWAERVKTWASGAQPSDAQLISKVAPPRAKRDVYCYFDNDQKVEAPFDAQRLQRFIAGDEPVRPSQKREGARRRPVSRAPAGRKPAARVSARRERRSER